MNKAINQLYITLLILVVLVSLYMLICAPTLYPNLVMFSCTFLWGFILFRKFYCIINITKELANNPKLCDIYCYNFLLFKIVKSESLRNKSILDNLSKTASNHYFEFYNIRFPIIYFITIFFLLILIFI